MRTQITPNAVKLWLSAQDTTDWATRPGKAWPCSTLRGNSLFAEFDRNGLVGIAINGRYGDCDSSELNAITSDFLSNALAESHPCWWVVVGQFQDK